MRAGRSGSIRKWMGRAQRRISRITFVILLLIAGGACLATNRLVGDQEHKLLAERSREVGLTLQQAISSISTQLSSLAQAAAMNSTVFEAEARADVGASKSLSLALLRPVPSGYVVVAGAGALSTGHLITGPSAEAVTAARPSSGLVATTVYGTGADRSLGFLEPASGGLLVLQQVVVGEPHPPSQAGSAPFSEVRVLLYAIPQARPDQLLVTTASKPLHGSVLYSPFPAGKSHWLLGVQAAHPLVGSVAADAPWAVLIVGLFGAVLVFVMMESVVRRRNAAIRLYEAEHRLAETLQRRLLPSLASPPGLDVASRYVAASDTQRVGGDWFDLFEIDSGHVGVAIGDVMGHDVEAAAAMAQIRAALRAYALEGTSPSTVLDKLARQMEMFETAVLVTVVYGILEAPTPDGSRVFRWANAGHLPPILHSGAGQAEELVDGSSPILGAPCKAPRPEASRKIPSASTLLMYTDGLVEVQGTDLADSLSSLRQVVADRDGHGTADELCETILNLQMPDPRRDDIALIAIQVLAARPEPSTHRSRVASAT